MDKLIKGIIEFKNTDFEKYKDLFREIGTSQRPHTLFIGCSDSRLVPNLITNTLPGELFVIRNIANIVPLYRATEEYVSTTSAIEYAVLVLNVENIVVCGHSNCGGCASLFMPDDFFKDIPHVKKWLELAGSVREKFNKEISYQSAGEREWKAEQLNVIEQMKHLLTYPFIRERVASKSLKILGWYYVIATGEIYNYDIDEGRFELIR